MTTVHDPEEMTKIWSIAKSAPVAMLSLRDNAGGMNARPMMSMLSEDEASIWFITDRHSTKMSETLEGSDALLTYSNMKSGEYLVFEGRISAVDDREKMKSLWSKGDDLFFPKGPEDDNAILLRFDPSDAEYWTGGSGAVKFAVQYVKMKLTGERGSMGEHRHVNL